MFVLCGAGVKNQGDVSKALSLGSKGILLASGVVKSAEPREALMDLIKGL
jgi:triosephosphate isomerase